MSQNPWVKLAAVSLVAIVVAFVLLWGISQFNYNNGYNGMNTGYGYNRNGNMQMQGMPQGQNWMNNGGMNMMQGGMGMH